MPPFVNNLEAWIYFTKPGFTVGWLALQAILLPIPIWFIGCRMACNGTFALGKNGKGSRRRYLRGGNFRFPPWNGRFLGIHGIPLLSGLCTSIRNYLSRKRSQRSIIGQ